MLTFFFFSFIYSCFARQFHRSRSHGGARGAREEGNREDEILFNKIQIKTRFAPSEHGAVFGGFYVQIFLLCLLLRSLLNSLVTLCFFLREISPRFEASSTTALTWRQHFGNFSVEITGWASKLFKIERYFRILFPDVFSFLTGELTLCCIVLHESNKCFFGYDFPWH